MPDLDLEENQDLVLISDLFLSIEYRLQVKYILYSYAFLFIRVDYKLFTFLTQNWLLNNSSSVNAVRMEYNLKRGE